MPWELSYPPPDHIISALQTHLVFVIFLILVCLLTLISQLSFLSIQSCIFVDHQFIIKFPLDISSLSLLAFFCLPQTTGVKNPLILFAFSISFFIPDFLTLYSVGPFSAKKFIRLRFFFYSFLLSLLLKGANARRPRVSL